jgi:hypothetical protein
MLSLEILLQLKGKLCFGQITEACPGCWIGHNNDSQFQVRIKLVQLSLDTLVYFAVADNDFHFDCTEREFRIPNLNADIVSFLSYMDWRVEDIFV